MPPAHAVTLSPRSAVRAVRRKRLTLVFVLSLGVLALAASARAWLTADGSGVASVGAPAASSPAKPRHGRRQLVQFTIYDVGLSPQQVHVEKGVVVILAEDLTGDSVELVVERETDAARERVGHVRRVARGRRDKQELELLTPGSYRIYDPRRPERSALLVVEP